MIRTDRVKLDHIATDPNNPRREFSGLDELAEQFRYNADRPGEPLLPILVVEDGVSPRDGQPCYRLVDGERRYRAMLDAEEVTDCLVNIADSMEEAASVAAMIATDDKQPLTEEERAHGVQMMLLLGTPDDEVEAIGRLKMGQARQIRRVTETANKAITVSMQALFDIAEIKDDAARAELVELADEGETASYEGEFQTRLRELRRSQESDEACAYYSKWCEDNGFKVVTEHPSDMSCAKRVSVVPINDSLAEIMREAGATVACIEPSSGKRAFWDKASLSFWCEAEADDEDDVSEEEAEEMRSEEELDAFMARMMEQAEAHRSFVFSFVTTPEPFQKYKNCAALRELFWKKLVAMFDLDATVESAGIETKLAPEYPAFLIPLLWDEIDITASDSEMAAAIVNDDYTFTEVEAYHDYIALIGALEAAGYRPSDFEIEVMGSCRTFIEKHGSENV